MRNSICSGISDLAIHALTTLLTLRKKHAYKHFDRDINAVIMDYLVSEGFPAAAQSFAVEANISQLQEDRDFIRVRVDIKKAIHTGNIQQAIELINELNPEVHRPTVLSYMCFLMIRFGFSCTTHSLRALMKTNHTLQSSV
jgi:hypothetical protein